MYQHEIEFAYLRELSITYPPVLQIKMVAEILKEDVPTIRARIRRGSFPIPVRQETGGRQYVLLTELVHFVCTGEISSQQNTLTARKTTPKRRGRPYKADQIGNVGAL